MPRMTGRRDTHAILAEAILLAESVGPGKTARQLDMPVNRSFNVRHRTDVSVLLRAGCTAQ